MYEQRPEVHERRRIQRNAANQRFEVKLKRKQVYEENGKEQKKFRMISDAFFRSAFDQMSPKHRAKIRYILRRQAGSAISIPDSLIVLKSKQVKLKSILNEKLK